MKYRRLFTGIALVVGLSFVGCGDEETGGGTGGGAGTTSNSGTGGGGTGAAGGGDASTTSQSGASQGTGSATTVGTGGAGGGAEVAPTWNNFAQDFFATYCVSCHSPEGQASADFNQYSVVSIPSRLNAIRCGVAPVLQENCQGEHPPGWFPIGNGPMPTDDERWRTVAWCEAGGPE